jgi:hypothetical protein
MSKKRGRGPSPKKPAPVSRVRVAAKPPSKAVKKPRAGRTPTGKQMNPAMLQAAERQSRDYLWVRTEEGHRMAGRVPPSEAQAHRAAVELGVDDAIRDLHPGVTEGQKLLSLAPRSAAQAYFTRTDPLRVMRIMGDFIEGFDTL